MGNQGYDTTIGSVTGWLSGGTPSRSRRDYWSGSIPWISASTLKEAEITSSDQFLTSEGVSSGSKMAPLGATLLLVRGSALHNEIRAGLVAAPVAFNQDVKALVPRRGVVPKFLTHVIRGNEVELLKLVTSAGNTAGVLDTKVVQSFKIFLPNEGEQRRLVEVFDDVDCLIDALRKAISKQQAMKEGVMEQLLTGRTRLPGFAAPWRAVRLGGAGTTYGGLSGKTRDDFGAGSAQYVTFVEVMSGARLTGRCLQPVRVHPGERQNQVFRDDVLINGSSETPEEVALAAVVDFDPAPATYLNSFCFGYRVKCRTAIYPAYLAYFFRSSGGRGIVSALAQGATRYNIAKTKLMEASPSIPPIDEQRQIVEAIRDSEAVIESLRARLAKAQDVKTGMMQQLLTGRTRLAAEGAS